MAGAVALKSCSKSDVGRLADTSSHAFSNATYSGFNCSNLIRAFAVDTAVPTAPPIWCHGSQSVCNRGPCLPLYVEPAAAAAANLLLRVCNVMFAIHFVTRLPGVRIDAEQFSRSRMSYYTGLFIVPSGKLVPAAPEDTLAISGYPEGSWINYVSWSPDGRYITFTTRSPGLN